jgi:predicted NUDIX family NTP pyrophosphohydrolase
MPKLSAGILLYRRGARGVEVLLVHPGGPLWARKDAGAWSIPKGEYTEGEDPAARAEQEFVEELGRNAPEGARIDLGEVRQSGGKRVRAWAVLGDFDADAAVSNVFEMRWPPGSDAVQVFPEVDRAAWFTLAGARRKLLGGQVPLLDRLGEALDDAPDDAAPDALDDGDEGGRAPLT